MVHVLADKYTEVIRVLDDSDVHHVLADKYTEVFRVLTSLMSTIF